MHANMKMLFLYTRNEHDLVYYDSTVTLHACSADTVVTWLKIPGRISYSAFSLSHDVMYTLKVYIFKRL